MLFYLGKARFSQDYRGLKKRWCGGVDSNHHGIATASPSSWCVCQFRHDRKTLETTHPENPLSWPHTEALPHSCAIWSLAAQPEERLAMAAEQEEARQVGLARPTWAAALRTVPARNGRQSPWSSAH